MTELRMWWCDIIDVRVRGHVGVTKGHRALLCIDQLPGAITWILTNSLGSLLSIPQLYSITSRILLQDPSPWLLGSSDLIFCTLSIWLFFFFFFFLPFEEDETKWKDNSNCNGFFFFSVSPSVDAESDYNNSCLLMVFIAVSLRVLIRSETTVYSPRLDAHPNNCHCFANAINAVAGALFTLHRRGDVEERLQEFLAVSFSLYNLSCFVQMSASKFL